MEKKQNFPSHAGLSGKALIASLFIISGILLFATAIYGSRAANGVIVITTKKGQEGAMHIDLDIKQGFTNIAPNNFSFCNAQQTADLFSCRSGA